MLYIVYMKSQRLKKGFFMKFSDVIYILRGPMYLIFGLVMLAFYLLMPGFSPFYTDWFVLGDMQEIAKTPHLTPLWSYIVGVILVVMGFCWSPWPPGK